MASLGSTIIQTALFFALLLSQTHLSEPFRPTIIPDRRIHPIAAAGSGDVHDILPRYGLPKGLLPNNVESYDLDEDDGSFWVKFRSECYVHFPEHLVYYDKKIKGKLSYGQVSDVSGIQTKKLFVWVPITGMVANQEEGMVEFQVGFLSESLPASQFKDIPSCKSRLAQSI